MTAVVIGVGNPYRHDDGVGPAVADEVRRVEPRVRVVTTDGEPTRMIDTWAGADVAVVVDAVVVRDPTPGRVHRLSVTDLPGVTSVGSSHGLGIPEAVELAKALDRMPRRLVFFTVEITETGYGPGLSAPVAAAVPVVTAAVLRELAAAGGAVRADS
jgi:hydrogenase maturation protease